MLSRAAIDQLAADIAKAPQAVLKKLTSAAHCAVPHCDRALPYLQGMPLSLQSLFRGRQGPPRIAPTAARIGQFNFARALSVFPFDHALPAGAGHVGTRI